MNLIHLRQQIDATDRGILQLLAHRMDLARRIRGFKKTVKDQRREDDLRHLWRDESHRLGLSEEFSLEILERLLAESTRIQRDL